MREKVAMVESGNEREVLELSDPADHRHRLSRQQIVEELLWFMAQHGCCGDPDLYTTLLAEAREQGWELPEGRTE